MTILSSQLLSCLRYWAILPFAFFACLSVSYADDDITRYWATSDSQSTQVISHAPWQLILDKYLIPAQNANDINRFDYASVTVNDQTILSRYLDQLQDIDPRQYNSQEQMAYWINIYNALTVNLILKNYPVKSITKLGEKFFSFGPWDDQAAVINNKSLTLNDIEHKILRPIWQDPRIHYAVNCASIGCPNLATQAYTSTNLDVQLEQGATDYINHPRGVHVDGNDLIVSKIYKWYSEDFGNTETSLIVHLKQYAKPALKNSLIHFEKHNGDIDYEYNWQLNQK